MIKQYCLYLAILYYVNNIYIKFLLKVLIGIPLMETLKVSEKKDERGGEKIRYDIKKM